MKESNKQRAKRTAVTPSTDIPSVNPPKCEFSAANQWLSNTAIFGVIFAVSTILLVFI